MNTTRRPVAPTDWSAALRERGLRVTRQRLAVLEALRGAQHSTAEELRAIAAEHSEGLTQQAVYLILDDLERVGLARRFDAPRAAARYEIRRGDNHHHLLCTRCGAIADVDCVVGAAPCLHPSDDAGFRIESADVVFRGVCADCRRTDADALDATVAS